MSLSSMAAADLRLRARAARLPQIAELEAHGAPAGFLVNRATSTVIPAFSYNPRRYVESRRLWARRARAQFMGIRATSLVTLTHAGVLHDRPIDQAELAHDTVAARRLVQRLSRFARAIDAGEVCVRCISSWECRLEQNPRAPFRPCRPRHPVKVWRPTGRCLACERWTVIHYYGEWLCAACAAEFTTQPDSQSATETRLTNRVSNVRTRFVAWQREPGESLHHLHRHSLFQGPYIPQSLFSRLAGAAGFGPVMDVRRFERHELAEAPLGRYLSKTARTPDPLSLYFTKIAHRPDVFNTLPKGARRKRAPRLPRVHTDWYWSPYDPRASPTTWEEPELLTRSQPNRAGRDNGAALVRLRPPRCVCLDSDRCICGAARAAGIKSAAGPQAFHGPAAEISARLDAAMPSVPEQSASQSCVESVSCDGALARGEGPVEFRSLHLMIYRTNASHSAEPRGDSS